MLRVAQTGTSVLVQSGAIFDTGALLENLNAVTGDGPLTFTTEDNISLTAGTGAAVSVVATGNGELTMTTGTGTTASGYDGIRAVQNGTGVLDIITGAGTVSGGTTGIYARNLGRNVTISTSGDMTGTSGDGIYATAAGAGGPTITTGASAISAAITVSSRATTLLGAI